jgi:hypothetical protein
VELALAQTTAPENVAAKEEISQTDLWEEKHAVVSIHKRIRTPQRTRLMALFGSMQIV